MKNLLIILLVTFYFQSSGQILSVDPTFPTSQDTVSIIYDANKGNGALVGISPIYAHAGLITSASSSPTNWKFVQGVWGQPTPSVLMTDIGSNKHKIEYHIPSFYGFPVSTTNVLELAFVFRDAAGNNVGRASDGGDIYYPVYPSNSGLLGRFLTPDEHLIVDLGDTIKIHAAANSNAMFFLFDNGTLIASDSTSNSDHFYHDLLTSSGGNHLLEIVIDNGTQTIVRDTTFYFSNPTISIIDPPQGLKDGINYINDSTVTLLLNAPNKSFVYVLGDFNNFLPDSLYFMNKSVDGNKFWITMNLNADTRYAFQYWIDGELKLADPYSELILDPINDPSIPSIAYPNPHPYPTGLTSGHCTLIHPGKQNYNWKNTNFQAPEKTNLMIYELLIRDFATSGDRNYQTIIDTLDYLVRLGINAIELMPNNEFENNESWGYNPSYHMALDKYYGTQDKYKELIDSCHSKGIAVIMDFVFNHAYGQSPLVKMYWDASANQPSSDNPWFNQNCPHPPYCWGYDFNHLSSATQNFMDRVNTYWIEEYNIDGIRFDFTKGFTNNSNSGWDVQRQDLLKRMADTIWSIKPDFYVILEHWGDNNEEKILSNYGMLLWGNTAYNYRESAMGFTNNSNFSNAVYKARGWNDPHLISYSESHDEERLMFDVNTYGNDSRTNYDIRDLKIGLRRAELVGAFNFLLPGPKLLYMFSELGYDVSINNPCRICNKPALWNYLQIPERRRLYDVTSAIINLRKDYSSTFNSQTFYYNLTSKTKRIIFHDSIMNANLIGNFDIWYRNIVPNFRHAGVWYDYFNGDSLVVTDPYMTLNLAPGEYRIYTDKKIVQPTISLSTSKNLKGKEHIRIYPNPSDEFLIIDFGNTSQLMGLEIRIFDMLGRVIISSTIDNDLLNNSKKIDVSNLKSGLYLLEIILNGERSLETVIIE